MNLGLLFWLVMAITLLYGVWLSYPRLPEERPRAGAALLWWVLLAILGWKVFGPALTGT